MTPRRCPVCGRIYDISDFSATKTHYCHVCDTEFPVIMMPPISSVGSPLADDISDRDFDILKRSLDDPESFWISMREADRCQYNDDGESK
ncbi:MAG: hypothetical protein GF411_14035 [Candidatus Lokiarchaeota archaeon]|nr:hypothetical protein [Candidatus Lokiarchaeota archaeon]